MEEIWRARGLGFPQEMAAAELGDAGVVIQFQRATEQKDSRKPMLMQIRASRRTR